MARLRQHTNPLSYRGPYSGESPEQLLGGPPTELEIGPGQGEHIVSRAQQAPASRVLGIEVRRNYVDICQQELAQAQVTNGVVIYAEARCDVPQLIADKSLDYIYLMFPDPWFKRRHHKRRVIDLDFAKVLASKLKVDGELHFATDSDILSLDIRMNLNRVPQLFCVGEIPPAAALSGRGIHHNECGDTIYGGRFARLL